MSNLPDSGADHPKVIGFPPFVVLGPLLLAVPLHFLIPLPWILPNVFRWTGVPLILAGYYLFNSTLHLMRSAQTNPSPFKPSKQIVQTGAFQYTRNPIYLGFFIVYWGIALLFHLTWALLLFIPLVFVVHYGIVRKEETYLCGKFGAEYEQYRQKTRRWL